jgi:hypothetical protein
MKSAKPISILLGVLAVSPAQASKAGRLPEIRLEAAQELHFQGPAGKPLPITAVSGAVRVGSRVFFVSDSQKSLYELEPSKMVVKGYALGGDPVGAIISKSRKPDLEALAHLPGPALAAEGALVAWPSASTPIREVATVVELSKTGEPAKATDVVISPLIAKLRSFVKGLNLEGLVVSGDVARIFQRGNEKGSRSGVFELPASALVTGLKTGDWAAAIAGIRFETLRIGKLSGVRLTFTDAAAYSGGILALAAAEASGSSYLDGPIHGSVLLRIQGEDAVLLGRFEPVAKLEAIVVDRESPEGAELLVFDDPDDVRKASRVFRAKIPASMLRKP